MFRAGNVIAWLGLLAIILLIGCEPNAGIDAETTGNVSHRNSSVLPPSSESQSLEGNESEKEFAGNSASAEFTEPLIPPIQLSGNTVPNGDSNGFIVSERPHTGPIPAGLLRTDFSSDQRALFEPHGEQICASGCAASHHPTPKLSQLEFRRLMTQFALEPLNESSEALEALLFYGRQTQLLLESEGTAPLNAERAELLKRELQSTHALWSFRVVDEQGVVRCQMKKTRVPLDRRHVFDMETENLPPLVTSGTVKRVGLHHLWTRI